MICQHMTAPSSVAYARGMNEQEKEAAELLRSMGWTVVEPEPPIFKDGDGDLWMRMESGRYGVVSVEIEPLSLDAVKREYGTWTGVWPV